MFNIGVPRFQFLSCYSVKFFLIILLYEKTNKKYGKNLNSKFFYVDKCFIQCYNEDTNRVETLVKVFAVYLTVVVDTLTGGVSFDSYHTIRKITLFMKRETSNDGRLNWQ